MRGAVDGRAEHAAWLGSAPAQIGGVLQLVEIDRHRCVLPERTRSLAARRGSENAVDRARERRRRYPATEAILAAMSRNRASSPAARAFFDATRQPCDFSTTPSPRTFR